MKYIVTINNKEYEVEVDNGKAAVVSTKEAVQVIAAEAAVKVPASQIKPPKAREQSNRTTQAMPVNNVKGEVIKAPMPGTILNVRVSPGTSVKKGQVLLILEAMKMENEIVAPTDGTVAQIQAVKGSSVNAGDVLAVIS